MNLPDHDEVERLFNEHALALGRVVHVWNRLQEELADLFWRVTDIPERHVPFAIWHSTPSDLAQRKMLRAAVEVANLKKPEAKAEIIWLLDQVDRALAHKRNDALHSPIAVVTDASGTAVRADISTGNPRAMALHKKEMLTELEWYEDTARALFRYACALDQSLYAGDPTLPKRPSLPHLGRQTTPMKTTPAEPRKERKPPPRSSPE